MKTLLFASAIIISSVNISFSQTIKSESTEAILRFKYVSENTDGEISSIKCSVTIDTLEIKNSKAEGIAQIDMISTSNAVRDKHLKSKTYFNLKLFPEISFKATEFQLTKSKNDSIAPIKCIGELSLKGFIKPVTFDVYFTDKDIIFKTNIFADDYGVAIKPGRENSLVELEFRTERN